jgi:serine/threonine protein kinase
MSEAKSDYNQLLRRIEHFSEQLYDAAQDSSEKLADDANDRFAPMFDALKQIVDRYDQRELIGSGGMKDVYRVYDLRSVRHVAMAKPSAKLQQEDFDAFLREAHLTARLEHPGIINLFDMGIDEDGVPFFTMEFKKGQSLREIISDLRSGKRDHEFSLNQRLSIVLRVCEAIAYAHSRRVLHLDVKPENIQVGVFGEVQLCDWGMGVVVPRPGESLRNSEVLLDPDIYGPLLDRVQGTPGYMAPEQRDPRERKTEQMDVYAIGCLLHEVVTLQPPEEDIARTKTIASALKAIIRRARSESSCDRYQTVQEMHNDITRFIEGYSTSVENSGFLREAKLFYRRNRIPCLVAISLLLCMSIGTASFVYLLRESNIAIVKNSVLAENSRNEAIENLARLQVEKETSDQRLDSQVYMAHRQSTRLLDACTSEQVRMDLLADFTMEHLDTALANDPPADSFIWVEKAWLSFVMQRFDQFLNIHDAGKSVPDDLTELARKYAPRMNAEGYLPESDFLELIDDLTPPGPLREQFTLKLILYDLRHQRSPLHRAEVIRLILECSNPQWENPVFNYSPADQSVTIGGRGLEHLVIERYRDLTGQCLLRILNPIKLNLSGTSISNLTELTPLQLHTLDLRDTPVSSLALLVEMRSLRELIVAPGQFSEEELADVPSWIHVNIE